MLPDDWNRLCHGDGPDLFPPDFGLLGLIPEDEREAFRLSLREMPDEDEDADEEDAL